MKKIVCILFVCINFYSVLAQEILKGQVVNQDGKPIEYVSIGIVGKKKGIISDENGFFKIEVSNDDKMYFSHLSYIKKEIKVSDFPKSGKVMLQENNIELPDVVVTSKKKKLVTIKPYGIRFPGATAEIIINSEEQRYEKRGIGNYIELKKEHIAIEFNMSVLKNTGEGTTFILKFYKVEDDNSLSPLITAPIYINIPKTENKMLIKEDLSVHLPKGKIWIELQIVKSKIDNGILTLPVAMSGGWERDNDTIEKLPLGIGLQFGIKGYKLE